LDPTERDRLAFARAPAWEKIKEKCHKGKLDAGFAKALARKSR
jgi:hypothetical protein